MRRFHHQQHSAEAGRGTGCSACFWLQGEGSENPWVLYLGCFGEGKGTRDEKAETGPAAGGAAPAERSSGSTGQTDRGLQEETCPPPLRLKHVSVHKRIPITGGINFAL